MGYGYKVLIVVLILIIFLFKIAGIYTDYLWFDQLGFSKIFLVSLKAKILVFLGAALVFFLFAMTNLWVAKKRSWLTGGVVVAISFLVGLASAKKWFVVLQYLNQVPFGLKDPVFTKDIGFYVFSLPFYLAVWNFALACLVLTIILVLVHGLTSSKPSRVMNAPPFKFKMNTHLIVLVSGIFILFAVRNYLSRFFVMYSEKGVVVGAGFTDVMVFLPALQIMIVLAIAIAALVLVLRNQKVLLYAVAGYLIAGFVVTAVIPGIVQSIKVTPNEINLEKAYIEHNIRFTRIAYGLDDVEEKDFPAEMMLSSDTLDKETIDNVRILDWRPLTQTYKQTQEIRLYYDLSGIDIDRYNINDKYTQVMLAPRELDQNQIAENAKTWVNMHMVYTHGFGLVMSPVNAVTREGLPNYYIKDIPPVYTVEDDQIRIDKPQIYYGERDNDFILVNTNTPEFDFPRGNENQYIRYDGKGGIQLDTFLKKLLMAMRLKDIRILLSSDVTPESKIMFYRNIKGRISKITPFLALDNDPYLVIDEGRLSWIQDAYTVSQYFPYSQRFGNINYMRNAMKIIVDAYDGDVTYYLIEPEPISQTYAKIFPRQFKTLMPQNIKNHIRYPEDLFKVQSAIYTTYHMSDPTVFYNKEDAWQIPYEIYGTGQQINVEPYYLIMKLPGEKIEEFILMTSFTPIKKNNMVSWLAARSDGENYRKLLLYKFPKHKLVYGPMQVEAKIDQDSEISEQLTLWSQKGSQVTRGNLLVIPMGNSILYIEPLYIQAEKGQLPELKRVLVSDGEMVVMEENLEAALESLFGKKTKLEIKSEYQLIRQANEYYTSILNSMNMGDWAGIGENFEKLGEVLRQLE